MHVPVDLRDGFYFLDFVLLTHVRQVPTVTLFKCSKTP
ncbi:hypothetical protein BRCON_0530 [Candidatus Sumerlaea chitinivorans]|uniref:Uncharacterized protein n=1 Tax=Sumerlaea chitinivorans TaxID=2250252 RepID=A0A2Z4Y269_SUMC1|nr:hypothetical protein BRCON_0530 [Candidatus Sumerlaea chitinivorans]